MELSVTPTEQSVIINKLNVFLVLRMLDARISSTPQASASFERRNSVLADVCPPLLWAAHGALFTLASVKEKSSNVRAATLLGSIKRKALLKQIVKSQRWKL